MEIIYPILSVIVVSLISLVIGIPFLLKKKFSNSTLLFLLSVSVGVLLSTVFFDFLPEILEHEYTLNVAFFILFGFLVMFLLEKFIHYQHNKKCENSDCGHSHAYSIAPLNLIGDAIHNFIDGLLIAGSYAVSTTLGIVVTISIIFHEIPQEIADFGVLLYSGLSRKKAFFFNILSATSAILGTIIGIFMVKNIHGFVEFITPFAAGNLLYIAASNLVPQLHRQCSLKDTVVHLIAVILGILLIAFVTIALPGHA